MYEGSWPWERASSANYEGSWPWEREPRVICKGSRPCEREPTVALRARIQRKLRGIAALGARAQCNFQGFASPGPALDFQEMVRGPKGALRTHIPKQISIGFCSGEGFALLVNLPAVFLHPGSADAALFVRNRDLWSPEAVQFTGDRSLRSAGAA